MIFSDPDPTFQLVSDPTWIFSNILNINVFPSCKYYRLYIMTNYKLFMEMSVQKWIYIFKWVVPIFVGKLSNFSVFQKGFTSNSFQIRNDFFPDPYPDPAKSFGSPTLHLIVPVPEPQTWYGNWESIYRGAFAGDSSSAERFLYFLRCCLVGRGGTPATRRRCFTRRLQNQTAITLNRYRVPA